MKGLEELEMVKKDWKGEKLKAEREWNTLTVSLAGHIAECMEKAEKAEGWLCERAAKAEN